MVIDVRVAITGPPESGRTTLCKRLKDRIHVRVNDGQHFCLRAHETNLEDPSLLESDALLLIVDLHKDMKDVKNLVADYGEFVKSTYWEQRKMFRIIGTKHDKLDPESKIVKYPGFFTTWFTMYTSLSCHFVGTVTHDESAIEEMCVSIVNQFRPTKPSVSSQVHKAFSQIRSWGLDMIASIFSLPIPSNVNQDTPDSDDLPVIPDDNAAWELIKTPESIAFNKHQASFTRGHNWAPTHKIAPSLVLKELHHFERFNNIFVRAHTNIPVPQPRYLHLKESLVTDFIPGKMLLECWDSFSLFYQFRIACTLRKYVSQLRRITSDRPGSIGQGLVRGQLFYPHAWNGPFRDAEQFCNWMAHTAYTERVYQYMHLRSFKGPEAAGSPPCLLNLPPEHEWNLVLTHGDLSLSNAILSDDGVLWIIDWADSGFYPPWIESQAMERYTWAPESWRRWFSFIVDTSVDTTKLWSHMECAGGICSTCFPREDYWPNTEEIRRITVW
ncbi:hypothetical protein JR316_0012344 [Psilocybe cubensis]|uniref:Aminoglycoside phosphotransferase domain-containing protein n=2 Tax=Psilocybe cubensis TaxID=181762 RepID=A0A8H8CG75_PSICU|nr:hypothetical protein JR316_0012344 [Psilocybe cubensis]KAH9475233.1 hypothetical protein JR316_0012344 [Psilocybe cubensis]